jgi:hypothetical protein
MTMGVLTACQQQAAAPSAPAPQQFKLTASIQEIMEAIVDPAADVLWESVGSTITLQGTQDRRPQKDEEWQQLRRNAITLIEATNLLAMEGRQIVPAGGKMLDEGAQGVLTAVEAQQRLDSQHQVFVQFAGALHTVGERMLKAIDTKNPDELMEAGVEMDGVCESCHLTFWYPNQVFPK